MFIAHLPSGYIVGRWMRRSGRALPGIIPAALLGSVAPDFDLLYFHVVDGGRVHHHDYVTHWPLFWLAAGIVVVAALRWLRPRFAAAALAFFLAAMVHMVLDSIASPISWLMPFSAHKLELVEVPARFNPWYLNFLFHWTFFLELLICAWAAWAAWLARRRGASRRS